MSVDVAPGTVAYTNARVLDPARGLDAHGGVLTRGGEIVDAGADVTADGVPADAEVVDCGGACVSPGFVDMQALLGEPGHEHKETIHSAGVAAASAGITSIACLPNTDPVIDDEAGLEFVARRARETKLVKVYAHGAVTRGCAGREMTEIGLLAEAGAVGFTEGLAPVTDAGLMRRALSYAKTFGAVISQRPEEPAIATGSMNSGALATRLGLKGRSRHAELMMIERDLRLAEMTGGRLHIGPVTAAESVELIRRAKARGLAVTASTAPPYLALTEAAVGDYRTFAKVAPPLRTEADRRAVAAAVADGTIDAVASDHNPQDQDSKRLPFEAAADGMAGLETLFALSLGLVHDAGAPLVDVLHRLTAGPAAILGLDAGRLRPGAPADLTVFDPDAAWVIDPDAFIGKCKNAPFDNHPVRGRVLRTVVDGRPIHTAPAPDAA